MSPFRSRYPGIDKVIERVDIGILERIQSIRGGLKPTLQVVADKVLEDPARTRGMNLKELAATCNVSEASISRFVRSIGLQSFRAFQLRLAEERVGEGGPAPDEGSIYESIGRNDTASAILTKVVHRTSDVARACLSTLDPCAIEQAAELIREAGALYVFSAGLSSLAAENAVMRFSRIGKPVVGNLDHNAQLLTASALGPGTAAIAISDSGRTTHTVTVLSTARAAGAATVALTSFSDSPLARVADVTLTTPTGYIPSGGEPLHESMVSKFGQLLTIDVLYSVVAVKDYDRAVASVRRGDPFIEKSRSLRRSNDAE